MPAAATSPNPQHATHHASHHDHTPGLVRTVRNATRRYLRVSKAEADGYGAFLGCTSGHDHGAMGLHYANGILVGDGTLDANRPEVLVYEPLRGGRMQLVAVEDRKSTRLNSSH